MSSNAAPTAAGNGSASGRTSPTPPGGVAVSAATYGKIDTSNVSKPAWMTRIPPKLAEAWEKAPEGTVLGTFNFTKGSPPAPTNGNKSASKSAPPRVEQSLTITVSDELAATAPDLPVTYTIEALTRKVPTLHPFTRKADGSIELHGTVAKTANLQMARTERYRNLCKNRLVASATSDRFVKPVDLADLTGLSGGGRGGGGGRGSSRIGTNITGGGKSGSTGGFGDSVQQFGKAIIDSQKVGMEAGRKRKFEGQNIRSVVFELFSMQRYWTVKDMRNASGRFEKEIRDVLSELAEFHRSGENKGSWELREEFRKSAVAAAAAPDADGSAGTSGDSKGK